MAEMTDVVYFLTEEDAHNGYAELRYSLRSLEKHVSGVARVFVVGAQAGWWQNIIHLPEKDPYEHNRDANIIYKMHAACIWQEISSPFLFVNDDHFFTRDVAAGEFPYFHKGEIQGLAGNQEYGRRLRNTRRLLRDRGLPAWNFDVHTPILITKGWFLWAFDEFDWEKDIETLPGVVMKSVYSNFCPWIVAAKVLLQDLKFLVNTPGTVEGWLPQLAARPCFSTGAHVSRLVRGIWSALYPEASKYEGRDI